MWVTWDLSSKNQRVGTLQSLEAPDVVVWECGGSRVVSALGCGLPELGAQGCLPALPTQKPPPAPAFCPPRQPSRASTGYALSLGLALCLASLWHCLGTGFLQETCLVSYAGRPSPELKVPWGQVHTH